MSYTIQVALDGVHFIDAVTVKLTVDNEEIQNETGFEQCGEHNISTVTVGHIDENGKKLAEDDIYKAYPISMVQGLGIIEKEIEGYRVVGIKESIDWDNDFVGEGRSYHYIYKKIKTEDEVEPPKAPASVKAVLSGGYDDVKVSWSKVSGATSYRVYYKKSTASQYTLLTTTEKLSATKKNLADGVKYYFKVVPRYKKGDTTVNSPNYKTASVYTLKKISTPKVTKVNSKKVKVSWTNINGESGYQISRSTKKTGTNIVSTYSTTSGKSKTLSVTKNKKFYYKVRAYKTVNGKKIYGPWSNTKAYTLK